MTDKLYTWRWWIWGGCILAWTAALLVPVPKDDPFGFGELEFDRRFFLAKGLHFCAYAFLTMLTGWLRVPVRYRFFLLFLLMAHATTTEVLQYIMEFIGRSGSLMDVALNDSGIAIGLLLAWRWWTQKDD